MKNVLTSALSMGAVCAFMAATPAFAQDTVTGAPAGTAPATVEGYGYSPGQPGFGYWPEYSYAPGYAYAPGYGYGYGYGWDPLAPLGAFAAGVGDVGAGVVGATGAAVGAALGAPAYAVRTHRLCHVYHDAYGRRICGP